MTGKTYSVYEAVDEPRREAVIGITELADSDALERLHPGATRCRILAAGLSREEAAAFAKNSGKSAAQSGFAVRFKDVG